MELITVWKWLTDPKNHSTITAGAAIAGVVVAAIYTVFAILQWCAMRGQLAQMSKQTTLQQQQLAGTQGALISLASPDWIADSNMLHFTFVNNRPDGVTGKIVDFSARLQRESLPDRKPIGESWEIHFSNEPVAARSQYYFDYPMPHGIPKTSGIDWPGKEGLSIDAHYTVDNGFGDTTSRDVCYDWLPPLSLKSPTDNSTTSVGGGTGGPCPHDISWNLTKFRNDRAKGYIPQPHP